MSALLAVALVVVSGSAYLFIGAVTGGLTMNAGEHYDAEDRIFWLTLWPLWLALMGAIELTRRGFALGQRLNPQLTAEFRAAAARELTTTLERLERENEIKLPTGELAHAPRSLTEYRAAGRVPVLPARAPLHSERRASVPPSRACDCPVCRDYRRRKREGGR